jgi:hypothetical protein
VIILTLVPLSLSALAAGLAPAEPTESLLAVQPAAETLAPTLAAMPAQHEDGSHFSYTYIEVGASQYDVDDLDDEADSYYAAASLALGMFHIIAGYENTEIDFGDSSSDILSLGAGAHFSLTPDLDIAGDISWLFSDVDSDISGLDDSENGYVIRAGPRWMPWDWSGGGLELNGELMWIDLKNRIASEDEAFGYGVGARVHFIELLSIGANYRIIEDDDVVAVNARVSF